MFNDLSRHLNGRRLIALARISAQDEWRQYALTGLVFGAIILFAVLFLRVQSFGFFLNVMLLAGIVMTSRSFRDIHEKEKGIYYLTLPASMEEKFLIRVFASLVLYFVYSVTICYLAAFIASFLMSIISSQSQSLILYPSSVYVFNLFVTFLFFHAFFFTASLFFKRNVFFKTMLLLMVCFFSTMLVITFYLRNKLIALEQSSFYLQLNAGPHFFRDINSFWNNFNTMRILVFFVLPFLLYVISYFKLRRIEVKS